MKKKCKEQLLNEKNSWEQIKKSRRIRYKWRTKGHWCILSARAKKRYYIRFSGYATTESQQMI